MQSTNKYYFIYIFKKSIKYKEIITSHGKEMAELPLEPIYAHFMLVSISINSKCISTVLSAISIMQVENIFYIPRGAKVTLFDIL